MIKKEQVMNALKKVIDLELGLDIVSLGLVYDIRIKDNFVEVDLTLTSPGCPMASQLLVDSEKQVMKIKEVIKVKIEFVYNPPWTPERMSPEARVRLGI